MAAVVGVVEVVVVVVVVGVVAAEVATVVVVAGASSRRYTRYMRLQSTAYRFTCNDILFHAVYLSVAHVFLPHRQRLRERRAPLVIMPCVQHLISSVSYRMSRTVVVAQGSNKRSRSQCCCQQREGCGTADLPRVRAWWRTLLCESMRARICPEPINLASSFSSKST